MGRTAILVLAADVLLLAAEFLVLQDLQWRSSFAASAHAGTNGYAPSFAYSILTQFFTMSGNGVSLTSPPTLDWVQLLAIVLVAINVWFGYTVLVKRRGAKAGQEAPTPPMAVR
jgi:hypothetical protein